METSTYSRPLGFAEMVRQYGDQWCYGGQRFAGAIHDERLSRAFVSSSPCITPDDSDFYSMRFYTMRIYSRPINEVRGGA